LEQEKAKVHEQLHQKMSEIVEMHKEMEEKSEEIAEKANQIDALLTQLNLNEPTRFLNLMGINPAIFSELLN
jgi:predicted  nucleic acid-binding Zn-ribbon protein